MNEYRLLDECCGCLVNEYCLLGKSNMVNVQGLGLIWGMNQPLGAGSFLTVIARLVEVLLLAA